MKNDQLYIEYYKWNKNNISLFHQSIRKLLNLSSIQFYMPFFSLYFYIHNTKKSHQKMDLKRKRASDSHNKRIWKSELWRLKANESKDG